MTMRRPSTEDLELDLAAKDEDQMRWMWLKGERESWTAMSPRSRREHSYRLLAEAHEHFGRGPKWIFVADAPDARYAVYVDCDLANDHVPFGEANISYSAHPKHRGKGYVSRSVRLMLRWLRDNTGAPRAHILVDEENAPSLRVARSVGALPKATFVDEGGRKIVRHVVELR
jgi:RimJ/RimL family protein N-acetyltransferase